MQDVDKECQQTMAHFKVKKHLVALRRIAPDNNSAIKAA